MRTLTGILLLALLTSPASAEPIEGTVVAADGRFVAGGRLIVTDLAIATDDGRQVTVVARGGRAGGFGQISWPGSRIPEVGARVSVRATLTGGVLVADHIVDSTVSFVRTGPTAAGNYLFWPSGCIFMTYDAAGTADLAGDSEFALLDQVLATWNDAIGACSFLELRSGGVLESEDPTDLIGNDMLNRVIFRDDRWCRPPHDGLPEDCLPSGAAGLTTVTYVDDEDSSRDGEIVDADVELNGEDFAISSEGTSLSDVACLSDLVNTFTHEMGHVMGLDHTCLAPGDLPKLDGNGDPVPLCSQTTDAEITEATMYNFQECGETKKGSPEPDDVDGVCDAYPREADPGTCAPAMVPGGCCSSSGGGAGGAGTVLVTCLLAASACRRRRSA